MNLFRFGVTSHLKLAPVGGRDGDIEHLDFAEALEHAPGTQSGGRLLVVFLKGNVQAVGEEADEDMGFDTLVELVKDRTQAQIALESAEAFFDSHQVHVVLPELCGVLAREVAA